MDANLRRLYRALDECDRIEVTLDMNTDNWSQAARDAMLGGIIERRGNLLAQLRKVVLAMDVEV